MWTLRRVFLRLALGKHTFHSMERTLAYDPRLRGAHMVDIIVRSDAVERRLDADWLKNLARVVLPKQTF